MITYKDIIKDEHVDLRKKCENVTLPLSEEDEKTLLLMNEYLELGYDEEQAAKYDIRPGVGIAAPQIDVLKNMFVICIVAEKSYIKLILC